MNRLSLSLMALAVVGAAQASVTVNLQPMNSFGVNGWLAPVPVASDPASYLGTGSLERGLAYNPVSKNLILVSRNGGAGNPIKILNGSTGANLGNLNQGSGFVTGGTFPTNMVGVADDGAIFVGNLSTASAAFKVYRWNNESSAPTVAFNATTGMPRTGDTMDVIGSGLNTRLVASGSGSIGYNVMSTGDGVNFTGAYQNVGLVGEHRLGLTFIGQDEVWGRQTGVSGGRRSTYSPSISNLGLLTLTSAGEAPMDYAMVGGIGLLATIDANSSVVRVYSLENPAAPTLRASLTNTTGTLSANTNITGQVKFGEIVGNTATLYAMSTNQGIQAFKVEAVPEPGTMIALGAGLAGLVARRRRRA